ncbi:hypothetical protein [Streptomyces boncukensis]|uniref:Uncharacterized protein n=1 Tax=Streptomyces boncukensis TaxID=2711219 RepID=A0A6G4WWV3_9ACTN|nr:hypothetical protein [Streptomyces boncukensis]NGO69342.1 hypothetical protein [Streptomyces boncukensis]
MSPYVNATDHTLMLLPFEEWISLSTAAQRADIDEAAAASVVRLGRRRGVLRTRGKGKAQQVMRVSTDPHRTSDRSLTPRK